MGHGARTGVRPNPVEAVCARCGKRVAVGVPSVGVRNDNHGHVSLNSNWDRLHTACEPGYEAPPLRTPTFAQRKLNKPLPAPPTSCKPCFGGAAAADEEAVDPAVQSLCHVVSAAGRTREFADDLLHRHGGSVDAGRHPTARYCPGGQGASP